MKFTTRLNPMALAAMAAICTSAVHAGTNNFVLPEFRGSAGSLSGYWESFTVAYGAPGNTPNIAGATTAAILTQVGSPSAFLTGSGNLYDPVSPTAFKLSDSTPSALGTVVLQARTVGAELDYGSVSLSYSDGAGSHSLAPLFRQELDRSAAQGAAVSSLWQWDLRGLNVDDYTISFGAAGSSMSFDSMTLDTWTQYQVVPEPSTFALLGLGALGLAARWARRRN